MEGTAERRSSNQMGYFLRQESRKPRGGGEKVLWGGTRGVEKKLISVNPFFYPLELKRESEIGGA